MSDSLLGNGPVDSGQPEPGTVESSSVTESDSFFTGQEAYSDTSVTEDVTPSTSTEAPAFSWKNNIDKDYAATPTIAALPDDATGLAQLAKMLHHAEKLVGHEKIPLPGKNATPDDWNMVWNKLGRPADPNGYDIKDAPVTVFTPDDPAAQAEFNKAMVGKLTDIMHKANLTKDQASKLYPEITGYLNELSEAKATEFSKYIEESEAYMHDTMGQKDSDEFKQNLAIANRAFQKFANAEAIERMEKSGIVHNPDVAMMMYQIGKGMMEDSVDSPSTHGQFANTAERASQKLREIYNNPDHPYFNRDHPGNKSALEEVSKLFAAGGSV